MRKYIIFILICVFHWIIQPVFALPQNSSSPLIIAEQQQMMIEQTRNGLLAKKLQELQYQRQTFNSTSLSDDMLYQLKLMISVTQANADSIDLNLNTAQQAVITSTRNLNNLEEQWQEAAVNTVQRSILKQAVEEQSNLLNLQQERFKILQKSRDLSQQTLLFLIDWKSQLQLQFRDQEQTRKQEALNELAKNLQQEQQKWLMHLSKLNEQLQKAKETKSVQNADYLQIEFYIFNTEEHSYLIQNQLDLVKLRNNLDNWTLSSKQNMPLSKLNDAQHQINQLSNQIQSISNALNSKINLINAHIALVADGLKRNILSEKDGRETLVNFKQLLIQYQKQLHAVQELKKQTNYYQQIVTQQLKKQLASRQELPGFHWQDWWLLGKKISRLPLLIAENLKNLSKFIIIAVSNMQPWLWAISSIGLLFWVIMGMQLKHYLQKGITQLEQHRQSFFFTQIIITTLRLLKRHIATLMLATTFIGLHFLLNIPFKMSSCVISLFIVIVTTKLLLELAHVLLMEKADDEDTNNIKLYYRLKWLFLIGGLITALTLLVHQLPINYEVQDFFGRLFMLFLLIVSAVLMRAFEVIPSLFETYLNGKHNYLRRVIHWLSFLVPLSLFCNALLGLIGYVELAWAIAGYQGLFLILLTAYLIVRGLLDELIHWLSEQCIRQLRNGWLWSEAFLKPMHQILKLIFAIVTVIFLFELYGWDKQSFVVNALTDFLSFKLFMLSNVPLYVSTFLKLGIIIAIFRWAARWSREFSYRWLFVGTKDLSLRNSLAIFTQYITVATGAIIALNSVGLSLSALTWIFSAFTLGIGLGLRDLANNFVSGVLLLIERPVKLGDWVSVGDTEGKITHIGMRSITVTASDKQELLVPNADVFSKIFINWTHHSDTVRVLVPIRVHRSDDPHAVKKIIIEVLKKMPFILTEPPPTVYFEDTDQQFLSFKAEYFVDMKHIASRLQVRSIFLFALWDRFKKENIHPPHDLFQEVLVKGTLDLPASTR